MTEQALNTTQSHADAAARAEAMQPRPDTTSEDLDDRLAGARGDLDDFKLPKKEYDGDDLFDLESRAAKDAHNAEAEAFNESIDAYKSDRPYKDKSGRVQGEGGFIANNHFDAKREKHEIDSMPDDYEKMSITEAAKALAKAEFEKDKTKVEDLTDVLSEKLGVEEEKINSERDSDHNNERRENLWNRVVGVKEKELERLKANVQDPKSDEERAPKEESRQEKLDRLREEAAQLDADRIRGNGKEGDKDRLNDIDAEILKEIMDAYDTEDPEDPRVKDAIDFIEKESGKRAKELADGESSKKIKKELYQTTDPEEARKYWEENQEKLGSSLEAYLAHGHEGSWLVERDVEVEEDPPVEDDPNTVPPPLVFEPPVDEEPPVDTTPTQPIPVVPGPVPERTPLPERRGGWKKKLAALGLGALAIVGIAGPEDGGKNTWKIPTGVSEPVEWSGVYDIDTAGGKAGWNSNHRDNVPEIRKVDESDNAFGKEGVSEETRTDIAGNYDTAEEFFKSISTKTGLKNAEKMQKSFDKEVKHYVRGGMKQSDAEALVKAEIQQYFAARDAQAARDSK